MATLTIDGQKTDIGEPFIAPAIKDRIDSIEMEFVHDGKGKASLSGGGKGVNLTERVQQGAPPHLIVVVRTKKGEPGEDRVLDPYGSEYTYAIGGASALRFNERNSIPLLGLLPQGDAPKAVSEGTVATG